MLRGYKLNSAYAPSSGYRYDGLYVVEKVGLEVTAFLIHHNYVKRLGGKRDYRDSKFANTHLWFVKDTTVGVLLLNERRRGYRTSRNCSQPQRKKMKSLRRDFRTMGRQHPKSWALEVIQRREFV